VLGALGYLFNAILERLERHFLRWRPAVGNG
jgi:ABC-type nitrate/sulfonate/bicarbonate transport system permease component